MKINSIIDLVKDLDTSRQTKNLNKLLIRILLHLQVEFSNKELYGEEKLLEMLSDNASSDVRTTVNVVVDSIASHVKEAEASDDLTILLIQYEPGTANS